MVLAKHSLLGVNDLVAHVGSKWTSKGWFCVGESEGSLSKSTTKDLRYAWDDRGYFCSHFALSVNELAFHTPPEKANAAVHEMCH